MNEYEQQAQEFLEKTGTSLTVEFQYTGPYFEGDTEKRDVYRFTLKNARGEYSANFGDSIRNTERRQFASLNYGTQDFMTARKLGFSVPKSGAYAISRKEAKEARDRKPSAYDILACLDAYDPGTFEDFCAEYGYDDQPLSRYPDALKTYSAVQEQVRGLRRIFSEEELEQLAEIV